MHSSLKRLFAAITIPALLLSSLSFALAFNTNNASAAPWPGYNGTIAYDAGANSTWQFRTLDSNGLNMQVPALDSSLRLASPRWSPDGSKIAVESSGEGNDEIYIIDVQTNHVSNITNNAASDGDPLWSPDGSKIAFSTNRDGGNWEIYTMSPDGSNATDVTLNPSIDNYYAWMQDSNHLLITSRRTGAYELYSITLNTLAVNQITNDGKDKRSIAWLSDGSGYIYEQSGTNLEDQIMYVDNANNITQLTNESEGASFGYGIAVDAISPNGKSLIYQTYSTALGRYQVKFLTIPGGASTLIDLHNDIFPNAINPLQVNWSPDGKQVLLDVYSSGYNTSDWYIIDEHGNNLRKITAHGTGQYTNTIDWQSIANTAPVTVSDATNVTFNTSKTVDVLANDSDEEALDGANLTITAIPAHGTALIEAGKVKYTPTSGYSGSDQLTYQICDSFLLDQKCNSGILSIAVQAPGAPAVSIEKVDGMTFNPNTGSYSTTNLRPSFSGTADPFSEITVEIHSNPIVLKTTADANGNWSISPTFDLPSGDHLVYISATLNGLTTTLNVFGLTIQGTLAATGMSLWIVVFSGIGALGTGICLIPYIKKNL